MVDIGGHQVDLTDDIAQSLGLFEEGHGLVAAGNIDGFGVDADTVAQNGQASVDGKIGPDLLADLLRQGVTAQPLGGRHCTFGGDRVDDRHLARIGES